MKKHDSHYTFMFCPEGKGKPFTLRVHRYVLVLTAVSAALIVLCLSALLYKTGEIALRLQLVNNLRKENALLKEYNRDLRLSEQKIANIDSMVAYLHRLAGVTDASVPPVRVAQEDRVGTDVARADDARTDVFASSIPNIMPVNGWITKMFSEGPPDAHHGIDIAAPDGTPIRVTAAGVVEDVRNDKYFGLTVEVRHENGFVTRYSHCSQVLVSVYDRVSRGQTIALVGNTGRSTAPHLHYAIMWYGRYVDPMNYIGLRGR